MESITITFLVLSIIDGTGVLLPATNENYTTNRNSLAENGVVLVQAVCLMSELT